MINTIPKSEADSLLTLAIRHLREVLGKPVTATALRGEGQLPIYLLAAYRLYKTTLMGLPCVVMVDKGVGRWTPAAVAKHGQNVLKLTRCAPVFVAASCTFQQRQRLIAHHVGFVIPGNQVFLPGLGVELRQRLLRPQAFVDTLSPATQVLVLKALASGEYVFSPTKASAEMGYTPMTLSRAFNELEAAGLARCRQQGRQRVLEFNLKGKELFDKAKSLLRSPVKARAWISGNGIPKGPQAGLSALSSLSDLAPPPSPCVAMSRKQWRAWAKAHPKAFSMAEDPESAEVQIWWYPPEDLAKDGRVDPVSLYLSLGQEQDERVEQALTQIEKRIW
jgi:DNA-binding MarR family transcriptional regulator